MNVTVAPVRLVFHVDSIHAVAVASNWLYLTGGPSTVVRINLDSPSQVEDIQLPRKYAGAVGYIKHIYTDASGRSLLAVTSRYEHFFYSDNRKEEFKHLGKLRGTTTLCAAFYTRHSFLLGTKAGTIVEVGVDSSANETYFRRSLRLAVPLWKSPRLDFVRALVVSANEVMAACGGQVLRWAAQTPREGAGAMNPALNEPLFQRLLSAEPEVVLEAPLDISQLVVSPDGRTLAASIGKSKAAFSRTAKAAALSSGSPATAAEAATNGGASAKADAKAAPRAPSGQPPRRRQRLDWQEVEFSGELNRLLVSDYYLLGVVSRRGAEDVEAINLFSQQLVQHAPIPMTAAVQGVATDRQNKTFWAFDPENLCEIRLGAEQAGMWRVLADQGRFEEALEIADSNTAKSQILERFGRHLLRTDLREGARLLGLSSCPLEIAALDVMRAPSPRTDTSALARRQSQGGPSEEEGHAAADHQGGSKSLPRAAADKNTEEERTYTVENGLSPESSPESSGALAELLKARLSHTKSRGQQVMLTSWLASLGDYGFMEGSAAWDVGTVLQILREKGDSERYAAVLIDTGDIDGAVAFYVSNERWLDALDLLRQHEHVESLYKYASILLDRVPRQTVESWMRMEGLDASRVLPCLIAYSSKYRGPAKDNHALRFLLHVLKKTKARAAQHNPPPPPPSSSSSSSSDASAAAFSATVTLLATQGDDEELLRFLREYAPHFHDLFFALRMCLKHGKHRSAVYLYTQQDLLEDAVQICLDHGTPEMIDLAVDIATNHAATASQGSEELRKFLLRKIAHLAIRRQGPAAAVRFIKLLRVDDLLAQFPDFDNLSDLAPEIVKSLENTNSRLNNLNQEINSTLQASEDMQLELAQFKRRSVLIEPGEPCAICRFPLVTRKCVVFPCQHGFHVDCAQQMQRELGITKDVAAECVLCSKENLRQVETPLCAEF